MHFALPLFLFITIHSPSCLAVLCASLSLEHINLWLSKLKQNNNNSKKSSSLERVFIPDLRSLSCKTWSSMSGTEAVLHSFSFHWGFSRFQIANPQGWDGSFLSYMPIWWSIAELRKPAQLLSAWEGSNLAQLVELWACVPTIQFTPLPSHPSWALAYQFNFEADFHQAGAGCAESVLLSCL